MLAETAHFWHLDTYLTRAEAEAAKNENGTIVGAFGKAYSQSQIRAGARRAASTLAKSGRS